MKKLLAQSPLIYLISNGTLTTENFHRKSTETLRIIEHAVTNGISLVQIREKNLPAKFIFELTVKGAQITQNSRTKLLVNDRADIAFLAGADGVHLTSASIPTEIIRQNFPAEFIIGVSCHNLEKCLESKNEGADFVTYSPIFPTPGKGLPKGLKELNEVCEKLKSFPVIALGGIDESNYKSVLENGASGFAAIRFLQDKRNLRKLAEEFLR